MPLGLKAVMNKTEPIDPPVHSANHSERTGLLGS